MRLLVILLRLAGAIVVTAFLATLLPVEWMASTHRARARRVSKIRPLAVSLKGMCRNIRTLANFAPPATDEEIRASALQFVRKLSGMNKPSRANEVVFERAVEEVTAAA